MFNKLENLINKSNNIVFFGGAGVSTESGIPDFRSKDGLYNLKYSFNPEYMLSYSFFINHTKDFYKFYMENMVYLDVKPNKAHLVLAELEKKNKLKAIITQNIDGLHQLAGSKNVIELHGSIYNNYCMKCKKYYNIYDIIEIKDIPICECGGIIKPDIVLYQENLNEDLISKAELYISEADLLIIGGTSLKVYPANDLVNYAYGSKIVIINNSRTLMDEQADLVIHDKIGNVLGKLK